MAITEAELKQTYKKKAAAATDPLEKLRYVCLSRGVNGIKALSRTFRIFDDDGSKSLNFEEFMEGLNDYGIKELDESQCKHLFGVFDKDGNGSLDFNEFLIKLQPPMNASRISIVTKAFEKADKSGDGIFTAEDLKGKYKVNKHPKYMSGEWTGEQVLRNFLDQFDSNDKDGKITKDEFLKYYASLSASIDNDAYFDLMIRQAWGL